MKDLYLYTNDILITIIRCEIVIKDLFFPVWFCYHLYSSCASMLYVKVIEYKKMLYASYEMKKNKYTLLLEHLMK